MVTFSVENRGHLQHVTRTICHTKLATFAALDDEVDLAARYLNVIMIKRFAPQFHDGFPPHQRSVVATTTDG
jgi:hypothetical protein